MPVCLPDEYYNGDSGDALVGHAVASGGFFPHVDVGTDDEYDWAPAPSNITAFVFEETQRTVLPKEYTAYYRNEF